jgi:hypothetical protein
MSGRGQDEQPPSDDGPNKAQAEFERYKTRLAATQPIYPGQPAMMMPWAISPGGLPGWALPPSLAAMAPMMPPPTPAPPARLLRALPGVSGRPCGSRSSSSMRRSAAG